MASFNITMPTKVPTIQPTEVPIPTPTIISDEEIIFQLVVGESQAFMQRNIDRLEMMWAIDGVEADAGGTSTSSDDLIWQGWEEIRERYINEFQLSYNVENTNVRIEVIGDYASAVSDVKFNDSLHRDQSLWTFRKIGGMWKIASLTFNPAK